MNLSSLIGLVERAARAEAVREIAANIAGSPAPDGPATGAGVAGRTAPRDRLPDARPGLPADRFGASAPPLAGLRRPPAPGIVPAMAWPWPTAERNPDRVTSDPAASMAGSGAVLQDRDAEAREPGRGRSAGSLRSPVPGDGSRPFADPGGPRPKPGATPPGTVPWSTAASRPTAVPAGSPAIPPPAPGTPVPLAWPGSAIAPARPRPEAPGEAMATGPEDAADLLPVGGRIPDPPLTAAPPGAASPAANPLNSMIAPADATPAESAGVAPADPADVAPAEPTGVAAADPAYVAQAEPTGVATADPAYVAPAEPAGVARADPADVTHAAGVATADPGEDAARSASRPDPVDRFRPGLQPAELRNPAGPSAGTSRPAEAPVDAAQIAMSGPGMTAPPSEARGPAPAPGAAGPAAADVGQAVPAMAGEAVGATILNAAMIPGWPPPRPFVQAALVRIALLQPRADPAELLLAGFAALGAPPSLLKRLRNRLARIAGRLEALFGAAVVYATTVAVVAAIAAELDDLAELAEAEADAVGPFGRDRS